MKLFEYQAKELLRSYSIPSPEGVCIRDASDLGKAYGLLGEGEVAVKAQVLSGGRGKAGGVRIVRTKTDLEDACREMLGGNIVTKQTGASGLRIKNLLVEKACHIKKEYFIAVTLDRTKGVNTIIASEKGGMEIETVASSSPDSIISHECPKAGMEPFHMRDLGVMLHLKGKELIAFSDFALSLYRAYLRLDATMLEVNPLALSEEGTFSALDIKASFDDSALFRQPELSSLKDSNEEDELEKEAGALGLNYIRLQGDIGCMVNGAGLAMATMDIIKASGHEPANFLDVGGSSSEESISKGFNILMQDSGIHALFVNIFGGIQRCDKIARAFLSARERREIPVPLIFRFEGTNRAKAFSILESSGIRFSRANDLKEASRLLNSLNYC